MDIRVGFGFDVHQLGEGHTLVLGGQTIPHLLGTIGHSDADVLLHAICDALLGALALGDIGHHFPDTDASFKNIDSKILLTRTHEIISEKGWSVVNLDCTMVLEKPKIAPYVPKMRETISTFLRIDVDRVSIKATTNERVGYIGREEGTAAYATVLLMK
jgi:2-C-methyl-D-erythritol 2,4-cyclodiphosphate synthase